MNEKSTYQRVRDYYIASNCEPTVREIAKALEIGHGTAAYHLQRLPEYKAKHELLLDVKFSHHHIREIEIHLKCLKSIINRGKL